MSLRLLSSILLVLVAAGCRTNDPPGKFDLTKVGDYTNRLNRSDNPVAQTIRGKLQTAAADLAAARKAARDAGLPVFPEDLKPRSVPASNNAAPLWQQIDLAWKRLSAAKGPQLINNPVGPGYTYGPGIIQQAEKELRDDRTLLQLIDAASSKSQCEFNRNWSLGPSLLFPEYALMRSAARILQSESYLLARNGKFDQALRKMERGFQIARQAASDPCLIAYLVAIAIDAITLRGMENLVDMAGPNAPFARRVRASIAANHPRLDFAHSLYGEMAMHDATMKLLRTGGPKEFAGLLTSSDGSDADALPTQWNTSTRKFIDQMIDANEAYVLNRMREQIKAARLPRAQRLSKLREIDAALERETGDPTLMIASILLPSAGQAGDKEYRVEAQAHAVMMAADVHAYRAERGRFPDSLEHAHIAPLMDPYSGKPMRYRKEPNGFVVYSVGPEGKFDGGKPGMKRDPKESYVRYPPPPPKPFQPPDRPSATMSGAMGGQMRR